MVLQQSPAKACVFGVLPPGATKATITISSGSDGDGDAAFVPYNVAASVEDESGAWKACLKPQAGGHSTFTVTATCTGCGSSNASAVATLHGVVFGDVWYCGGQSNMALPLTHTLSRNISRDAVLAGKYGNIRIHGIKGNMNPDQPWSSLKDALVTTKGADSDHSPMMGYVHGEIHT
jgi:hypothetical protein